MKKRIGRRDILLGSVALAGAAIAHHHLGSTLTAISPPPPPPPPPPGLADLTANTTSVADDIAIGAVAFIFTNKTAGSTITISPNDGRFLPQSDGSVTHGSTAISDGTISYAFTETPLVGAPHTTTLPIVVQPPVPIAAPSASFNGNAGSGFAAAPYNGTPPTISASRASGDRAYPSGHVIIPDDLVVWPGGDLTIPVAAKCDLLGMGLAGVRAHPEGGTPIFVTTSRLLSLQRPDGTTYQEDVYAVKVRESDWGHHSGTGGDIYFELVPNDLTKYQPLVLPPFRILPRAVENDWFAWITPNGKTNAGVNVADPGIAGMTYAGTFTTIKKAVTALQALGDDVVTAPKMVIAKDGFYEAEDITSPNPVYTKGWLAFTVAAGVTATVRKSSAPTYADPTQWPWTMGMSHVEFRGRNAITDPGLIFDHLNFSFFQTGFGSGGHRGWDGCTQWFNGCFNTISCAAVADARGNMTKMNNTYWNGGIHPGMSPNSSVRGSPGAHHTHDYVEAMYSTFGNGASYPYTTPAPVVNRLVLKNTPGPIFQAEQLLLQIYLKDIDTRFIAPDLHPMMTLTNTSGHTITVEKNKTQGGNDGTSGGDGDKVFLVDNGTTHTFTLGAYPATTDAAIKTFIDGLSISGLICTLTSPSCPFAGVYINDGGSSGDFFPPVAITSTPRTLYGHKEQHTEADQGDPLDNVPAHSVTNQYVDGFLIWGRSMLGTTPERWDHTQDSYFANVLNATMIPPDYTRSGDESYPNGDNTTSIYSYEENDKGIRDGGSTGLSVIGYGSVHGISMGSVPGFLAGAERYRHTIMSADSVGLHALDASNLAPIGGSAWDALLVDRANFDFRAASGSAIDTNKTIPIIGYDFFRNARPAGGDWNHPISSSQVGSTAALLPAI